MIRVIFCMLCSAFLTNKALEAQQGGSNYSIFGIGDIRQSMGSFYDGLA